MNKDFKYLLENCREESLVDGVFTFITPDDWANVKKKRAIDKAVADNIIEPVTKERIYYRMCNCNNDSILITDDGCDAVEYNELLKDNADLRKMVDHLETLLDTLKADKEALERKVEALQNALYALIDLRKENI